VTFTQIFMAAGCRLEIAEIGDKGVVLKTSRTLDATFYTAYRRNVLTSGQVRIFKKIMF
jgi:hypothetical protein